MKVNAVFAHVDKAADKGGIFVRLLCFGIKQNGLVVVIPFSFELKHSHAAGIKREVANGESGVNVLALCQVISQYLTRSPALKINGMEVQNVKYITQVDVLDLSDESFATYQPVSTRIERNELAGVRDLKVSDLILTFF